MFSESDSIARAQDDVSPDTQVNPASSLERLREIADKHQVCYEVWPERSVAEGAKIQIGFELQLCGTNSHVGAGKEHQPVPGCEYCQSTYEDLKQIAEEILPREGRPSRYEIGGFDRALHVAPHSRQSRNEVVLTIHIMHRANFNWEVDDCENRCLKEMRGRLKELGIYEGKWRSDAEKTAVRT
jgi:hypothetical protein